MKQLTLVEYGALEKAERRLLRRLAYGATVAQAFGVDEKHVMEGMQATVANARSVYDLGHLKRLLDEDNAATGWFADPYGSVATDWSDDDIDKQAQRMAVDRRIK